MKGILGDPENYHHEEYEKVFNKYDLDPFLQTQIDKVNKARQYEPGMRSYLTKDFIGQEGQKERETIDNELGYNNLNKAMDMGYDYSSIG